MTLKLYNTRTRTKEEFKPLDPANVRMYVCGPTVYDYAHIGNARPVIVFDVLYRLLRHLYGESHVTYVRNITDVDDKINARAAEQYPDLAFNDAIRKLTEETAAQYQRDVTALGCLPPTHQPRATEYIDQMKAMIETLIDKGCAYVAENHVLFHVSAMPDYGQLARRSLDEMRAGARVEVAPYKRDPMDFVLWKPSKDGEPSWPSPRGINAPGRPGWHLECSAMSKALLGETFDIHGGGIDLVFPHHENEVAQSRCAHGTDIMANVWMHNGHLQVEGAKMSKSLGNFVTINALLSTDQFGGRSWPGAALRLAMLRTHYRQPIDWTLRSLDAAYGDLRNWAINLVSVLESQNRIRYGDPKLPERIFNDYTPSDHVIASLKDDLNTHEALDRVVDGKPTSKNDNFDKIAQFFVDLKFLGLFDERNVIIFSNGIKINETNSESLKHETRELRTSELNRQTKRGKDIRQEIQARGYLIRSICEGCWEIGRGLEDHEIQELVTQRLIARKLKNWAEADRIRDALFAKRIILKDAKDPDTGEIATTWEIARDE